MFHAGRFDRLAVARSAVTEHMHNAQTLMRQACETFAQGVRDRCDLGALATLNCYNYDVVAAMARIVKAKGEMFSVHEK